MTKRWAIAAAENETPHNSYKMLSIINGNWITISSYNMKAAYSHAQILC